MLGEVSVKVPLRPFSGTAVYRPPRAHESTENSVRQIQSIRIAPPYWHM